MRFRRRKIKTESGTTLRVELPPGRYDLKIVQYDRETKLMTFEVVSAPAGSDIVVGSTIVEKFR